ncbi:hypothetical protein Pcinc_040480 [Petrolisthes cinctipes]|uniref:Uncharacterized protein n=1 Tax=Petrolisthes cinctipes TaxID=88211 RepID=A0AAE1BLV6_PETCI|nr:hypothetical protein Pcinc_040480 [Petrolisthes cinctipes]
MLPSPNLPLFSAAFTNFASFSAALTNPASTLSRPSCISSLPDWSQLDEEHRLIAHYAARLANQASQSGSDSVDSSPGFDASNAQRDLIQSLEAKNRDIMREISSLRSRVYVCRRQQERAEGSGNPTLVAELRALRSHRYELESNLSYLQDSRKHLMQQLEGLMKMLKNHGSHQSSPTTPNGSPRSPPFSSSSLSLTPGTQGSTASSRSAPPTPSHTAQVSTLDSLSSFHADGLQSAVSSVAVFSSGGESNITPDNSPDEDSLASRSLRNDLLVAADSVTNAMSSLVRELNSDYDFKGLYENPSWRNVTTDGTYSDIDEPLSHLHIRKASADLQLPTQGGVKSSKRRPSTEGREQEDLRKERGSTPDWEEAGMGWVNSPLLPLAEAEISTTLKGVISG